LVKIFDQKREFYEIILFASQEERPMLTQSYSFRRAIYHRTRSISLLVSGSVFNGALWILVSKTNMQFSMIQKGIFAIFVETPFIASSSYLWHKEAESFTFDS